MGLVMLGWAVASTIGPLLAGGVADAFGARAAYALMVVWCALFGLWLLRTGRSRAAVDLDRLYGAHDLDELRGRVRPDRVSV